MTEREELLRSPEYWHASAQIYLYEALSDFMTKNRLSVDDIARRAEVTKRQIKQTLNGDFNQSLYNLAKIALACGVAPIVEFKPIEDVIEEDELKAKGK